MTDTVPFILNNNKIMTLLLKIQKHPRKLSRYARTIRADDSVGGSNYSFWSKMVEPSLHFSPVKKK